MLTELIIAVHELSSSLLVKTRLWKRYNQEASDDLENVFQRPFGRIPVSFQSVHTDLTRILCHIRMVDLGQEEALWGTLWETTFNDKFAAEDTAFIGCLDYMDVKSNQLKSHGGG